MGVYIGAKSLIMSIKGSDNYRKTDSSRQSSVERYAFGYTNELQNQECSISQAKRLRERLQRQQSGQSGCLASNNPDLFYISDFLSAVTDQFFDFKDVNILAKVASVPR